MSQHVTPEGHEAIVREDWERDTLHVLLRRRAPGTNRAQYAQGSRPALTTGPGHNAIHLGWDWEEAPEDGSPLPDTPGLILRRDDATAIHAALGEALGYDATREVVNLREALDQAHRLAGEQTDRANHMESDRNEARATIVGLERGLAATQDTLALVREWHTDTRARLERAETPPILATLGATRTWGGNPGQMWTVPPYSPGVRLPQADDIHDARDVIKAVMDQVGPARLCRLVVDLTGWSMHPYEPTAVENEPPEDDAFPVGTRLEDRDGDVWAKEEAGWSFRDDRRGSLAGPWEYHDVQRHYGPLKPTSGETPPAETETTETAEDQAHE